jgi:serine/threonine-protein kinase
MERLKRQMSALGPLAEGPGHEALGRGFLALERYDDALAELTRAWDAGYRSPELAYALGMVHGKQYQRALAELQKTNDPKLDAALRSELVRAHRDPALRYLKEAGAHERDGQVPIGIDAPEYVEGLIALYEQRFPDALVLARKAAESAVWPYEARTLEGDIHLVAGKEALLKGDVTSALAELEQAGAAYRAASESARSGFAALSGDCERLVELERIAVDRDQSPEAAMKKAIAACGAAAAARPDAASPLIDQAHSWQQLALYQGGHGVDPGPAAQQAILLAERALAVDSRASRAHTVIGRAWHELAWHALDKGRDPREALAHALEHASAALRIDPRAHEGYVLTALANNARGIYEDTLGIDPRPSFQAVIDNTNKALELAPDAFRSWNGLGNSHWNIGQWELRHGLDPTGSFGRAVSAYERVVQLSPSLDFGYINMCGVRESWADLEERRGNDPTPQLNLAIASCEKAIQRDGNYVGSHDNLGNAYLRQAIWQVEHGNDPSAFLRSARAALERALAIDHEYEQSIAKLAECRIVEARWLVRLGRDPEPAFADALAIAQRALAASGDKAVDAPTLIVELHWRRAEWQAQRHRSFAADVREGMAVATRALEHNPGLALAAAEKGALALLAARAATTPAERTSMATIARQALEQALAIDANLGHQFRPLQAEAIALAGASTR